MTRALYDDGPACTYSNGTGEACVCGLGVGTAPAPCPLHPPRHSSEHGRENVHNATPLAVEIVESLPDLGVIASNDAGGCR